MYVNKVTNINRLENLPKKEDNSASLVKNVLRTPVKTSFIPANHQPLQVKSASYIEKVNNIDWISNPILKEALVKLGEVKFLAGDKTYMKNLGVNILFESGEEAIDLILKDKIQIQFGKISSSKIYAQWENDKNLVIVNENFSNPKDKGIILAISEAIFHEIGHAKDKDGFSSIQEEIDCLALNTLANRYHQLHYQNVFAASADSKIINDGVGLYTKLFYDKDPEKAALKARIKEKYGDLPLETPNHKAFPFARSIL